MLECKDRHFLSSTRKLHPQLWLPGPKSCGQGSHKENVIALELKPYTFVEPSQDWMKVKEDWDAVGSELPLGRFQELGRAGLSPQGKRFLEVFSNPFAYYVCLCVCVCLGGGFSSWSGLERICILLGREVSNEHLSSQSLCVWDLGHTALPLRALVSPSVKYEYFNINI